MNIKRSARIFAAACSLILLPLAAGDLRGQSTTPRFEVGGQYSLLNFDTLSSFSKPHRKDSGVGGRFTYNLNKYVAVDTQIDFFPHTDTERIGTIDLSLWGSKTLAVFGAKAGFRGRRFGVFGKARPGLIHFSSVPTFVCIASPCPQPSKTNFAFNVGGVIEYYASRRLVVRIDAGDAIIRHDKRLFPTSHQFQTSIGLAIRF